MTWVARWARKGKERALSTEHGLDIPPALAGGTALVVAALAAVGVSGGVLTRTVRNEPQTIAKLVIAALLIVAIPTLVLVRKRLLVALCLLALLGVLGTTVWVGAESVAEREQPRVALSASTKGQVTTITINASGTGLKSKQDMLVQLQAVTSFPTPVSGLDPLCFESVRSVPETKSVGPLLLWQQAGPDETGTVTVKTNVEIPIAKYEGVCAFVALRTDGTRARAVRAYLRTSGLE
jgi:hypothetical protein